MRAVGVVPIHRTSDGLHRPGAGSDHAEDDHHGIGEGPGLNAAETTPVYGVLSNPTLVDFPGRLAAVMFVSGCNFRCGFCHNAGLLATRREGYTREKLAALCDRFRGKWVTGVVVTGGEPTLAEGLPELLAFLRGRGFAVKLDTNGSRPEVLSEVLPLVDYVAMDVKCAPENYPRRVAHHDTDAILRSVALVREHAADYEFRTTVVPGWHEEAEMHRIGEAVRGARRFILQAFVPREELLDPGLRTVARTQPSLLEQFRSLMSAYVDDVAVRGG